MLLNDFDPSRDVLDRVVIGEGDWSHKVERTDRQIVSSRLPFNSVTKPVQDISVVGSYSIDGSTWYPHFPFRELYDMWKAEEFDIIEGVIRFPVSIVPDKNMNIRELGFYSGTKLCVYQVIKPFPIGKMEEGHPPFRFNYNVKCHFATSSNINFIATSK